MEEIIKYISAGAFLSLLFYLFLWRPGKKKWNIGRKKLSGGIKVVLDALYASESENKSRYLKLLKKTASLYSDEAMIYILIGNMIRHKRPQKAVEVHRGLLFRKDLTTEEKAQIHNALAEDYLIEHKLDKAYASLKRSLTILPLSQTYQKIISVEKKLAYFEDAFQHQKELNKKSGREKNASCDIIALQAYEVAYNKGDLPRKKEWTNQLRKINKSSIHAKFISLIPLLEDGKNRKAASKIEDILENHSKDELSIRYFLAKCGYAETVNMDIDGFHKNLFEIIFNNRFDNLQDALYGIQHNTLIYNYLISFTVKDETIAQSIQKLTKKERLFSCKSCGAIVSKDIFLCTKCNSPLYVEFTKTP